MIEHCQLDLMLDGFYKAIVAFSSYLSLSIEFTLVVLAPTLLCAFAAKKNVVLQISHLVVINMYLV